MVNGLVNRFDLVSSRQTFVRHWLAINYIVRLHRAGIWFAGVYIECDKPEQPSRHISVPEPILCTDYYVHVVLIYYDHMDSCCHKHS